jgi:WD40 repeat protein
MLATNLVVPVVLWGPNTPTHCVSSVFLSRDQRTLATGCYDGQICLWQIDSDFDMTPRCLLRKKLPANDSHTTFSLTSLVF